VRRIAELHQGEVRIEDREGGGTRCVLALQGVMPAAAD
jgi:signal transduction histidine kinase